MLKLKLLTFCVVILTLSGCGGGGGGGSHHHHNPEPAHFPPELVGFHLVDSYGDSSEDFPNLLLALNPYLDDGLFEVYWYVDSVDDYTVALSINDRPSFAGSRLVSTEYCGIGLPCDRDGLLFCEYNANFSMFCDPPDVQEPGIYLTYFDDMVLTIPQTMYFLFEVCDTVTDSCEFQIMDVSME